MDYRQLIKQGKQEAGRRTIRHAICLQPSLYSELEEAQDELQVLRREALIQGDTPVGDRRAGSLTPVAQVEARIADIEARRADASIVGVFIALSPEKAAERMDQINKELEDNPAHSQAIGLRFAQQELLMTFSHFEDKDQERLDLTLDDLKDIVDLDNGLMSHGEIAVLSNKISRAATEVHDAPKFVRSSLPSRNSDGTSPQPAP